MTRIILKYVHVFRDRHGKRRAYFRRRGHKRVPLPGLPGSPEFMQAYQLALQGEPQQMGAAKVPRGSLSWLISEYYQSADFLQLAAQTKKTYRGIAEKLRKEHGHRLIKDLQPHHIRKIMSHVATQPNVANGILKIFRALMKFAYESNLRHDNPAALVKNLRVKTEGYHSWTEEEIAQFERRWPLGTKQRLAFDLYLYTAQRKSDVRVLGRQHLREGNTIALRQQKTKTPLLLPIHPALERSLAMTSLGDLTFLVTAQGKPFSDAGFGKFFGDAVRAAGLPRGVSGHGLRKAAARRLADAGCTFHEIMAITGHKTPAEVLRYTRAADQARLARSALKSIRDDEQDSPQREA